jgi:hypothetical protein
MNQQLAVGEVIHCFHGHDLFGQLRLVVLQIFDEFMLRLRRADDEHLVGSRKRFGDPPKEFPVLRRPGPIDGAFAVMDYARIAVCLDNRVVAVVARKTLQVSFVTVDPG